MEGVGLLFKDGEILEILRITSKEIGLNIEMVLDILKKKSGLA